MEEFPTKAGPTAGQAPVRHLYVHIPFCHRICPYCSFHKHTPGGHDLPAFFRAVVEETRRAGERYWIDPLTIYFGGGTPTLPSRTTLAAFFKEFRDAVDVSRVSEFTFEANPRTFDRDKITFLLDQGVTRISLGVQAWDQRTLTTLGRDHSPAEGADAYATLRAAGVPSVNIDLMFSVPGQTLEAWRQSLHFTAGLEPDHVSAYNLNYEEDTEFFSRFTRGEFSTDPEADAVFFDAAVDVLEAAGLAQYEVSNYARPGCESRHNQACWSGADYLGLGPGAFSTVAGRRWKNIADTATYAALVRSGGGIQRESEELTPAQLRTERLGLQLRTRAGLPLDILTGDARDRARSLEDHGLATIDRDRIVLTPRGRLVADSIAVELM